MLLSDIAASFECFQSLKLVYIGCFCYFLESPLLVGCIPRNLVFGQQHLGTAEVIVFFLQEVLHLYVWVVSHVVKILNRSNVEGPPDLAVPQSFFVRFASFGQIVLVLVNFETPLQTLEVPAVVLGFR